MPAFLLQLLPMLAGLLGQTGAMRLLGREGVKKFGGSLLGKVPQGIRSGTSGLAAKATKQFPRAAPEVGKTFKTVGQIALTAPAFVGASALAERALSPFQDGSDGSLAPELAAQLAQPQAQQGGDISGILQQIVAALESGEAPENEEIRTLIDILSPVSQQPRLL